MRYRRMKVEGASYFFTVVTGERRPLFREAEMVALLDAAIDRVRTRHPFEVVAQVVLPDHLHAIWQLPEGDADYSKRWRLIKEAFTKACAKRFGRIDAGETRAARGELGLWQKRFWEHLIRDERDFAAHLDYIHLNPVHHGYISAPCDWPHSTFKTWVERGVYGEHWGSGEMPAMPDWAERCE